MKLIIHRGTRKIGGNCIEIRTANTRVIIDIGTPLTDREGTEFDLNKYQGMTVEELRTKKILPDIDGLYKDAKILIDGVLISHPHIDHYGFSTFLHPQIYYYLGGPTHKLIEMTSIFTPQTSGIKNYFYVEKSKPFYIGDIKVTPFWMDHSAFDAYAFLLEAENKSIFYTGDFRGHGRKSKVFRWFTHNAPSKVDYLLMEGTNIDYNSIGTKTEHEIEGEFLRFFSQPGKINLIYVSGQNIDRLVSIYRACIKTEKTMVVDVYTACILKLLSGYAAVPYPSKQYQNMKVMFPYHLSKRLARENKEKLLYQFKDHKITKEEIGLDKNNIVMLVRPSMVYDLKHIQGIDGGNFIYSLWQGYLAKEQTKDFVNYLTNRSFETFHVHTSGHATLETLNNMVDAIKPKNIIPIHTFHSNKYQQRFSYPVILIRDGEEIEI